jgi:DnaD/phage-associated family protein
MKVKGMPRKRYFYIVNDEAILTKYILQGKEIQQLRQKGATSSDKRAQSVATKGHLNNTKGIINTNFEKREILKCEEESINRMDVDQEVINIYKDCISSNISNREVETLKGLQEAVGKELLNKAIVLATMKNGKNLGYIQAVLDDWKEKGLTTLDQVNKYLANWLIKNKKANENRTKQLNKRVENKDYSKNKGSFNDYEQRTYDFDELEKKLLGW